MNGFRANVGIMLFTRPGLIKDIHSFAHNLPFYFEGSWDMDECAMRLSALPQVFSAHSGFGDRTSPVVAHTDGIGVRDPTGQ